MKGRVILKRLIFLVLFLSFVFLLFGEGKSSSIYVKTNEGRRACVEGKIFLRIPYSKKVGMDAIAEKYCGDKKLVKDILKYNPRPKKGSYKEVRIPLELLLPSYQIETIFALFKEDKRVEEGFLHKYNGESFETLAKYFCSSLLDAGKLKKSLNGKLPKKGEYLLIPASLLSKPFANLPFEKKEQSVKSSQKSSEEVNQSPPQIKEYSVEEARKLLTYGKDEEGEYALYHLSQGEALYSSVVVRFTGRLFASEVNGLAMEIAKRSKIDDVTSIPINYEIKIPLEYLLPQFYPEDSNTYKQWLSHQQELSTIINTYKNSSLDGVVVILDPGHGGVDRGAINNKVWEDSYVYDIACRIKEGLESKTKAKVYITLVEPTKGFKIDDKKYLSPNKKAQILTHPPFSLDSSLATKRGVNLRWVLANSIYNNLSKERITTEKVVFTSIHADSLHPSLRGTMFYVPGSEYREQKWSANYENYKELKGNKTFSLSQKELKTAEGLSTQFSKKLEGAFKKNEIRLHPYSPTRDHVVRNRKAWVPAVLKYNLIPCSVLIEVCNINNKDDANLLCDPYFRQKIANAYIEALIQYYS